MTLNPFTIKELRQLTRSRTIAGALICYLFLCVGICYGVPLFGLGYNTGALVFTWLILMFAVASVVVVPSVIFISMMAERRGRFASDMTLMTSLPPSGIVDGKLRAGFALMGLFASATLPSALFANLMRGIDWIEIGYALAVVLSAAFFTLHGAVLVGATRISGVIKSIAFIVLLLAMAAILPAFGSFASFTDFNAFHLAVFVGIAASASLAARALSVFLVSPATSERDLPLRVTSIAIAAAWCAVTLVTAAIYLGDAADALKAFSWTFVTYAEALAAIATCLKVGYSRRMVAGFSGPFAKRLVRWPFSSGAANSYVFATIFGCACALVFPLATPVFVALRKSAGFEYPGAGFYGSLAPLTVFVYTMSMLLFCRAVWRFASRFVRTTPLLAVFVAGSVTAFLQSLPFLLSLGPDMTVEDFARMPFFFGGVFDHPMRHLAMACGAFATATALNSVALFKAVRAELFANVRKLPSAAAAATAALAICAAVLPRSAECAAKVPLPPILQMLPAMPEMPAAKAALAALRESGASLNLTLWAMQLAVMKQDEIAADSKEIEKAATEAGHAKDDAARAEAWKRLEAGERKLFTLLDLELNGMKLSPADKLTAKKTYWRMAAAEIEKNEPSMTDPAAKKFFETKKTIYRKKSSVGMANKKTGKR